MKYLIFLFMLLSILACSKKEPNICSQHEKVSSILLSTEYTRYPIDSLLIKNDSLLKFIHNELCNSKRKFILNKQGDGWYIRINFLNNKKKTNLTLTKTIGETYYFRDESGTYSNDILAKSLEILTGVEGYKIKRYPIKDKKQENKKLKTSKVF